MKSNLARPLGQSPVSPLARALTERGRGGFNPASLFAGGEVGVLYDFTDVSSLFQDSAGTTAIASGTGMGLVLDKSRGLARGVERLTNHDFADGGTGWTVTGTDATHIVTFASGVMRYQSDTTTPTLAVAQTGVMTVGAWYEVTVVVSGWVSGSIKTDDLGANTVLATGAGTFKVRKQATATGLSIVRNSTNVDITVDSVSVRELPGNHATQTTSASKPRWDGTYATCDGFDDFLSTASIDFTGTNAVTVVAGIYKASDAALGMLIETSTDGAANNGAFFVRAPQSNGATNISFGARGTTLGHAFNSSATAPISAVVSGEASITAPYTRIRTNGVLNHELTTSLGTGPLGNYPLYIGRRGGTAFPFNGRIHRLLIIGRALTAAELAQAERWAAQPTGVTL